MRTLLNDVDESGTIAKRDAVRKHAQSHFVTHREDQFCIRVLEVGTVAEVVGDPSLLDASDYMECFELVDEDCNEKQSVALQWILKSLHPAHGIHSNDREPCLVTDIPSGFLMSFW